jgi:hypothetical protein
MVTCGDFYEFAAFYGDSINGHFGFITSFSTSLIKFKKDTSNTRLHSSREFLVFYFELSRMPCWFYTYIENMIKVELGFNA